MDKLDYKTKRLEARDTVIDCEDILAISSYKEQIEHYLGEDGKKLWWAKVERFLQAQAEITWRASDEKWRQILRDSVAIAKLAGIKEAVEWLKRYKKIKVPKYQLKEWGIEDGN